MRVAMRRKILLPALLLPLLSACGGGSGAKGMPAPPTARPGKAPVRAPVRITPPPPRLLVAPGLEGVIGASGQDLLRQFGPARLDLAEGDARKLQFSGPACVLDVYLYPQGPGREPVATHVDARRASDGLDVDRAACVGALRKR